MRATIEPHDENILFVSQFEDHIVKHYYVKSEILHFFPTKHY